MSLQLKLKLDILYRKRLFTMVTHKNEKWDIRHSNFQPWSCWDVANLCRKFFELQMLVGEFQGSFGTELDALKQQLSYVKTCIFMKSYTYHGIDHNCKKYRQQEANS